MTREMPLRMRVARWVRGLLCFVFGHEPGWRWTQKSGWVASCRYCGKRWGAVAPFDGADE